jgi:hypothetical protein
MKPRDKRGAIRWQTAEITGRVGTLPLLLTTLPIGLLALWLGVIAPESTARQQHLTQLQQQLRVALPFDKQQPDLQSRVSLSEYQQVRLVFEQLEKHGLKVESSRYQLGNKGEDAGLQLDIPLRGEYLPLMEALEKLSRTLPLQIKQITLRRSAPTESQLSVALQIRLLQEAP